MQKKVLIAIDESNHAKHALTYAANLLARTTSDYHCALINVQPIITQYLLEAARIEPQVNDLLKKVNDQNAEQSRQILEKGKEAMVQAGVRPEAIDLVSQTRMQGLSKDIMEYGRKNLFDAIVVGRRGITRLQKVFLGSVSTELVEHCADVPLWVVDENNRIDRLLVAVDNSPATLVMVDYLCRMCSGISGLHFIFFHVRHQLGQEVGMTMPSTAGSIDTIFEEKQKKLLSTLWPEVTQRLNAAGFEPDQYELQTQAKNTKIGKMILDVAASLNCDTIVLGRRGSHQAYYFGSIARYVTTHVERRTVWVV